MKMLATERTERLSMEQERTTVLVELEAMKQVAEALSQLEKDAVRRVLLWVAETHRIDLGGVGALPLSAPRSSANGAGTTTPAEMRAFTEIADLFAAAAPSTDGERMLVAGYWFQISQGSGDFDSLTLSTALKELGHRVTNPSQALDRLAARRPQLVIQTRKTGGHQQARKRLKLTSAGLATVRRMLEGIHDEEESQA